MAKVDDVPLVIERVWNIEARVVEVASMDETFAVDVDTIALIAEKAASCPGVPVALTISPAVEPEASVPQRMTPFASVSMVSQELRAENRPLVA
jgi:hypothetical protein